MTSALDAAARLSRHKVFAHQARVSPADEFKPLHKKFLAMGQEIVELQQRQKAQPYPKAMQRYVSLEKRIGRSNDWVRISRVAQHVYRCANLYDFHRNPY